MDTYSLTTLYWACNCISLLRFGLVHVSKRSARSVFCNSIHIFFKFYQFSKVLHNTYMVKLCKHKIMFVNYNVSAVISAVRMLYYITPSFSIYQLRSLFPFRFTKDPAPLEMALYQGTYPSQCWLYFDVLPAKSQWLYCNVFSGAS